MLAAPVITGRCLAVPGGRCAHGSADLDRNQPSLGFPSRTWIRKGGTDSCSVFSYSEFKLVPASTSFHLASLNQQWPAFFLPAVCFSMCCLSHFSLSCCVSALSAFPPLRFTWLNLVFRASEAEFQNWPLLMKH